MRFRLSLALAISLTACGPRAESSEIPADPRSVPVPSPALAAPSASPSATSRRDLDKPSGSAPAPSPALAAPSASPSAASSGVPEATFGRPGPLRIVGYPVLVGSGFAALALAAGFTPDGEALGVCYSSGGSEDATCRWQDRAGTERTLDVPMIMPPGEPARLEPASATRWLPLLRYVGPAAYDFEAPPLRGSWPFARDIVLHVVEVRGNADGVDAPRLRVGGSVGGRAPVFPIEIQRPPVDPVPTDVHFIRPNAVALSPDGRDLGLVVHSATAEYDSTYTFHRLSVRVLAARIYGLTAARARRAGKSRVSRMLCALAAAADAGAAREPCGP